VKSIIASACSCLRHFQINFPMATGRRSQLGYV
jgi:hypothetical protein